MQEQPKKLQRWTIKDVLAWTTEYFAKKRIKTPRLMQKVLLASSLGVDRLHLYLNLDRPLLPQERERYRELVRRRGAREPVALIVGKKEFWSIHFMVVPGVQYHDRKRKHWWRLYWKRYEVSPARGYSKSELDPAR